MKAPLSLSGFKYVIVICSVVAIGGFLFGFDTAVISGVVLFLKGEFSMSPAMEGWFVSSALLGCIIGVVIAGRLSDQYGRKRGLLLSAVLFMLSAIGCMLSDGVAMLISFRLMGGLGIGVASMVCPLYISEISTARLRGRMVTLYQLAITVGILAAYFSNAELLSLSAQDYNKGLLFNNFLDWIISEHVWRAMFGMGAVPSIAFLVLLFFIPESPRWLFMKKREKEAETVLKKVNGAAIVKKELVSIRSSFTHDQSGWRELLAPVYRVALIIGLLLPFLSQLSGINAIIYYGPRILNEAGFTLGHAFGGQVVIGIVNVIFTIVAIFIVDRWGRRPLLALGVSLAIIALAIIGLLFSVNIVEGPWILLLLLVYIASFAISFGPVCWVIIGEIFPTSIRGLAMSLATLSIWVANFFVGQLTPTLLDNIGAAGTFWLFAILCSPTLWLIWKLIPETKGKTLEDIEKYWRQRG